MSNIETVPLSKCEFDKKRKVLTLASEYIGMPREFWVYSEHSRKHVMFRAVTEDDTLFDPDGWDGEQQKYRPVLDLPNVDHMVIYHQY